MAQHVVICLFASGGWGRVAQGLAGAGRELAGRIGGVLHSVVVGPADEEMRNAVADVADSVTVVDQPELLEYQPEPYLAALHQACAPLEPAAVLLHGDIAGVEHTARLAARLGGSPMSDAAALDVVDGAIRVTRSAYGGKAEAVFELKRSPAVIWLRARAFDPAQSTGRRAPVNLQTVEFPGFARTTITARHVEQVEGIPLEDAALVVGGGRGVGGPEGFGELRRLADAMGAAVGASRAACDEGWIAPTQQIGQTGKKIAPALYLAVAVSGAAQHMLGVTDAKVICAVNTDAEAPIFRRCRFGIVDDYRVVIPALIERLRELS
jgi:electron transfer flavoprotein alpha subunit